jgi:uroporphyrinogen-III synthase
MSHSLQGRTVVLAEGRQLEEMAQLLDAEGAVVLRYPMLNILDAPEPGPVRVWIDALIAGEFSHVILMTGEALRRLVSFSTREGKREAFLAALARTHRMTRGPKPVQALKEVGLTASSSAQKPTTEGIIATLQQQDLGGKTVGYTLSGVENPTLDQFLQSAGAQPCPVLPYIYAPQVEEDRIVELIQRLQGGGVDAILFTSAPQVDRLFAVASDKGMQAPLHEGLARTTVAAVGPVCADRLRHHQAPVHLCPEQGFVMKNLILQLKRTLAG